MYIFKLEKENKFTEVQEIKFKLEKDIQRLTELNLEIIFGFKFVKSEFIINNFRIDTLAYDGDRKSFVIIEYKKDRNFSVIDQGVTYLSLMLNNKADFILEYNENLHSNLKRSDIEWDQSRVIFISPSFTDYQKESINFKDLPIELWEVHYFNNQTISFIPKNPSKSTESIKTISKQSEEIEKVSQEVKVYSESEHIQHASEGIVELYERFKTGILNIDSSISIKATKTFISFISGKKAICDFHLFKNYLKLWINLKKGNLDDPKNITRDVSNVGHWGNGDYEIQVEDDKSLEYIISLVRESYDKNTLILLTRHK